jgi:hypothetical protein
MSEELVLGRARPLVATDEGDLHAAAVRVRPAAPGRRSGAQADPGYAQQHLRWLTETPARRSPPATRRLRDRVCHRRCAPPGQAPLRHRNGMRLRQWQWDAFELNDIHHRRLYYRDGFAMVSAHCRKWAMLCSARLTTIRCSRAFAFDDPDVAIEWPAGRVAGGVRADRVRAGPHRHRLEEIELSPPLVYAERFS